MLSASALCHHCSWNWDYTRHFQVLDYMGISLMIAGSYTPCCIALEFFGTLGFVWCLCIFGTLLDAYKVWIRSRLEVSTAYRAVLVGRFLLMGWAIAPSLSLLYQSLPGNYLVLTIMGGLIYTLV